MLALHCLTRESAKGSKIYPRTDEAGVISKLLNWEYEAEYKYFVINGNTYREAEIVGGTDIDLEHKYDRIDTSIYQFVNDGGTLVPYMEAYEAERNS